MIQSWHLQARASRAGKEVDKHILLCYARRRGSESESKPTTQRQNAACSTACQSTLPFAIIDHNGYIYTLSSVPRVEGDSRGRRVQTGAAHSMVAGIDTLLRPNRSDARRLSRHFANHVRAKFRVTVVEVLTRRAPIPSHLCNASEHRLRVSKLSMRRHQPVVTAEHTHHRRWKEDSGKQRPRSRNPISRQRNKKANQVSVGIL